MPCYNESPDVLLRTVDSIVGSDYPAPCIHIFLSFDGDDENDLYLSTIEKLDVPLTLDRYPRSIDVSYRYSRITVSRFPHGGKRKCQKNTFRLIDKIYAEYLRRNDDLFILFIDSDCILDRFCIQNFMYEMQLRPGSKGNMLAMTGVITTTTEKNSLLTVLQDMEYIHGQLFERSVESGCGAVTCLPGALTILRFSAFRRMAKYYFADKAEQCDDLFDYGKCHLGEDRWLTHLFMIGAQKRYQIQMNTAAFCKTEAVQTFASLLKQRRRWFLGFITNEACMLTDIRLWRRYPMLLTIRLAQNTIRTTALLFFIMVLSIITTSQKVANLPVGFIAVSLGLNWILMLYFGAKLARYKIMLYPLMFVLNPFFNWLYMVYGIFTAGQRTWGGPRADAGKADEKTSPAQAVAIAAEQGDELNVDPESFKPALKQLQPSHPAALMPAARLEGRFAPAEVLPGGWYQQRNDSGALGADMVLRRAEKGRRGSDGSMWSRNTSVDSASSVWRPRRVESLFDGATNGSAAVGEDDTSRGRQADTRPPSVRTSSSDSSVSMHFGSGARRGRRRRSSTDTAPPGSHPPSPEHSPTRSREIPSGSRLLSPTRPRSSSLTALKSRGTSAATTTCSPLARKSFTRLAADVQSEVGPSGMGRRHSVAGHGMERRGRRSVSVDAQGRRRLSKQGKGGGKGKRAESR